MREAGLEARLDEVSSVFGRVPNSPGPWLLLGSHTDTVPAGGRLDGAYGVIAGLEVLRALHEAGHPAAPRVEVVSFADEEGVGAGGGLKGSRHLVESAHSAELSGYLELHIEQGPRLEAEGLDLAAVEGIVGIDHWEVVIQGAANHAGTTPMPARRDAGRAAGRVMHRLNGLVSASDPEMVGNIGALQLLPGAPNVIPGQARLVVELRALQAASLQTAAEALHSEVMAAAEEARCHANLELRTSVPPVQMDPRMIAAVEAACRASGRGWRRLTSGAGHDAGKLATRIPAAMIFIPSRGGVSHSPDEYSTDEHLVMGAQVLMAAALNCLAIPSI
ncbi:MAG TPA: hydantoinase/carbamoylase family amidase [Candidatus Dormibacteraeota bacterium]